MTTVSGLNSQIISAKSKLEWKPVSREEAAQWDAWQRLSEAEPISGTAANDPSNLWGEIKKGGEVIARIYKGGVAEFSEKYDMKFSPDNPADRAAEFMKRFGGALHLSGSSKDLFSL